MTRGLRSPASSLRREVRQGPQGSASPFEIGWPVTDQGSLLYVPGGTERTLVLSDRRGRVTPITSTRGPFRFVRLSPDGRRVAVSLDGTPGPTSIWTFDLQRGTPTRLTSNGHNLIPVWRPTGNQLVHNVPGQAVAFYLRAAEAGGDSERLLERGSFQEPSSWTPDGQTLLYTERGSETQLDIWSFTLPQRDVKPVLITPDNERMKMVSPDGRWMAYISDESGRNEVSVRPRTGSGGRVLISIDGGTEPVWARNSREAFFRRDREYYAVPITAGDTFAAAAPQYLFTQGQPFVASDLSSYDVTPDGEHFLMIASDPDSAPTHFRLVSNWVSELEARTTGVR